MSKFSYKSFFSLAIVLVWGLLLTYQNCAMNNGASMSVAGSTDYSSLTGSTSDLTIVTQPLSYTAEEGLTLTISVTATSSHAITYQWYKNGGALLGETTNQYVIVGATEDDAASYSVTLNDGIKTITSNTSVVTVNSAVVTSGCTDGATKTVSSVCSAVDTYGNKVEASAAAVYTCSQNSWILTRVGSCSGCSYAYGVCMNICLTKGNCQNCIVALNSCNQNFCSKLDYCDIP